MTTKEERLKQKRDHYHRNKIEIRERQRLWREKNIDQVRESQREYSRRPEVKERKRVYDIAYNLKKKYGITLEEYQKMYKTQGGKCKLCLKSFVADVPFKWAVVDHNHVTGQVRGLLCDRCNKVLGMIEENRSLLKRMVVYLSLNSNLTNQNL